MGTTRHARTDLLFTSVFLVGMMILLIVTAPAALGFGVAVGAALWWCWWLDSQPDR